MPRPGSDRFASGGGNKIWEWGRLRNQFGIFKYERFGGSARRRRRRRRAGMLLALMMFEQGFANSLGDDAADRLLLPEFHFALRGVNVHVHESGIDFQK